MDAILDRVAFAAGEHTYEWRDVVESARRWGDWRALEDHVREVAACAKRAAATGERADPAAVAEAATAFRYERELVSAQDAERWLAARGLDAGAWMEHIRRAVLRRQWSDEIADILAAYPPTGADLEELLPVEAICTGALGRFGTKLAERAAARASLTGPTDADDPAAVDAAYDRLRATLVSPRSLAACIEAHRLDWLGVRCRTLFFQDLDAAREAALCLRDDCRAVVEVAAESRATLRDEELRLEDVGDAARRDALLGARPGEVVGPSREGNGHVVTLVVGKTLASTADPECRARAERELLRAALGDAIARHVRWHVRL